MDQIEQIYEFGPFRLNPRERRLLCEEKSVKLTPQQFALLLFLVQSGGRLIEEKEFLDHLWKGVEVNESALPKLIHMLRKTLNQNNEGNKYIEKVHPFGYRFVASVRKLTEGKVPTDATPFASLRVLYHGHCFDGVASAATFTRFYKEHVNPDAEVRYEGLLHRPGNLFDVAFDGDENAIVDFKYSSSDKVTWWFDHHESAFLTPEDEAHFRADKSGRKFLDPTRKSCTEFIADVAHERFGFNAEPIQSLVHWAHVIDGALYESPAQCVELKEPALQLMQVIEADPDEAFIEQIIRDLTTRSLEEVATSAEVQRRFEPILRQHLETLETVRRKATSSNGVVHFDLIDEGYEGFNKFIPYYLYPEATYSVALTRGPQRTKISVGSNPWAPMPRIHNIAKICERYGGGGHPVVGAISLRPDELREAREITKELVAVLSLGKEHSLAEAKRLEQVARDELISGAYQKAVASLEDAIKRDPLREERVRAEFGFILNTMNTDGSFADDSPDALARINWCCSVWQALAERNSFPLLELDESKTGTEDVADSEKENLVPTIKSQADTAERKGDQLEQSVARLFRTFFQIGDDLPWKIRQQKRGTQGGYDLSIEWSGKFEVSGNTAVRCHIECKNYKDQITPSDVAEKLLSEPRRNPLIEHWILISPRSNPSNSLNDFLERQKNEGTFPFEVQIWCPETGIDELFGLEPNVYDLFFAPREGESHPRSWDDTKRTEVRAKWRKKLEPLWRLPLGWSEYARNPDLLCVHQEKPAEMAATFANHVRMYCRNTGGALLEKPLDEYVDEWLCEPDEPILFLLGEFGDGKSFFSYALARRLISNWIPKSEQSWMPLRLALRTYPGNARDFLRNRLETFGANLGSWAEIGNISRRLVILDGFDEMSVELDPMTVTKNIKALLSCLDEFKDCKVLVSSRTHFFQNRKDVQRLLTRTGMARIYHLAPIGRSQVVANVSGSLSVTEGQELLHRLEAMNDPIGLAGKPLFLEMLKEVLGAKDLPMDLDIISLYERYIDSSLYRKRELLDDPHLSLLPAEVIKNLKILLGAIAVQLQRSGEDHVLLRQLGAGLEEPFAQMLWRLSGSDTLSQDARSRVGARSLLGRVIRDDLKEDWPVDFCHRSMREYFVAISLCEAVEESLESGAKFLKEVPLNHEILEFAAERWRKSCTPSVKRNLLALISNAIPARKPGRMGGYALTLLYRLEPNLPREFRWTNKVFDGADLENADLSGLDFRESSFRHGNLANVNFEKANFERCDLRGVRIEETAPVLSIARNPSGDCLVVAYRDGILRQWHLKPGGKTPSKILTKRAIGPECVIGIHDSGQAWLHSDREWTFLTNGDDGEWNYSGHFSIKRNFVKVRMQSKLLLFSEKLDEEAMRLVVCDLDRQVKLCSIRANTTCHFASLGRDAVIWSDAQVGFHVTALTEDDGKTEIILSCNEPACLDVLEVGEGVYLVASGTGDGVVHVWKVNWHDCAPRTQKLLEARVHEGSVTAVAFLDPARVSSGGSDCAIVISRWLETGNLEAQIERKLQLKIRCRGLKVAGLRGELEHSLLAKLVKEARDH